MSYEDKPNIEDVARNAQSNNAEAMYYIMKMDGQIKELEKRIKALEERHII